VCALAAQKLHTAQNPEDRSKAQAKKLKGTVLVAKQKWANDYIEKAKLWDVAAWRYEQKVFKVSSL
jgi:hypothetical protein